MNGLMDFVFPYLIQFLKEYTGKVDNLWKEKKERQEAAVDEESAKKQQEAQTNAYLQLMPLALPAPPGRTHSYLQCALLPDDWHVDWVPEAAGGADQRLPPGHGPGMC